MTTTTVYKQQALKQDLIENWTSSEGQRFRLLAVYSPNEDNDRWVEYVNVRTGQQYNCRMEAFLGRFHPQSD